MNKLLRLNTGDLFITFMPISNNFAFSIYESVLTNYFLFVLLSIHVVIWEQSGLVSAKDITFMENAKFWKNDCETFLTDYRFLDREKLFVMIF